VTQLDLSQSDLQGADHPNVDSPSGTVIDFIGTTGRAEVKGNSNCIVYFKKKNNCIEEAMYYELFTPGKSLESNWHQHHPLYHANLVLHFYCLSHLVDSLFFAK